MLILLVPFAFLSAASAGTHEQPSWNSIEPDFSHPQQCHLKLVCAITASKDPGLLGATFMRGIRTLAVTRRNYSAFQLAMALKAGDSGRSCGKVAPNCELTEEDLLDAVIDMVPDLEVQQGSHAANRRFRREADQIYYAPQNHYAPEQQYYTPEQQQYTPEQQYYAPEQQQYTPEQQYYAPQQQPYTPALQPERPYNPYIRQSKHPHPPLRRQSSLQSRLTSMLRRQSGGLSNSLSSMLRHMPPIMRPDGAGARSVCKTCDTRRTICTVYSLGSYAGCTGVWLMAGVPGQLACQVVTAPGSMGCAYNTYQCFQSGCGLINVNVPGASKKNSELAALFTRTNQ